MGLILLWGLVIMLQPGNSERKAINLNITCLQSEITKTKRHSRKSFHLMGSRGSQPQGRAEQALHNKLSLSCYTPAGHPPAGQ